MKFSPGSRALATGGMDRRVKLWEVIGGKSSKQEVVIIAPFKTATDATPLTSNLIKVGNEVLFA